MTMNEDISGEMDEGITEENAAAAGQEQEPEQGPETQSPAGEDDLTRALEATLNNLNQSIERMEDLVHRLESGEGDWEESVRLLAEANDLAMSSSQQLDRAVQDVMYGGEAGEPLGGAVSQQEKLPLENTHDNDAAPGGHDE